MDIAILFLINMYTVLFLLSRYFLVTNQLFNGDF